MKKLAIVFLLGVTPHTAGNISVVSAKDYVTDRDYFTNIMVGKSNTTFEFGGMSRNNKSFLSFGGIFFSDSKKEYLKDPEYYQQKGKLGFYGKYGIQIQKNSNIYLSGILGLCLSTKSICREWREASNLPLQTKVVNEKNHILALYGIGLNYFLLDKNLCFSVNYDNQRKLTGGIGYCWRF